MKKIIRFQADDGSVWNSQLEAEHRDELCKAVDKAMRPLGDDPILVWPYDFENGDMGYVQHSLGSIKRARAGLWKLAKPHMERWLGDQRRMHRTSLEFVKFEMSPALYCRLLDSAELKPIADAYYRLARIDELGREWGQVIMCENPHLRVRTTNANIQSRVSKCTKT